MGCYDWFWPQNFWWLPIKVKNHCYKRCFKVQSALFFTAEELFNKESTLRNVYFVTIFNNFIAISVQPNQIIRLYSRFTSLDKEQNGFLT